GIHVLFIGRPANSGLGAVLERIADQPVLLVTEMDDVRAGVAINFVVITIAAISFARSVLNGRFCITTIHLRRFARHRAGAR
ncbi:MAG TPA: YfiR/HmsC family protein, partial [Gammaproteobacteria bacterium]